MEEAQESKLFYLGIFPRCPFYKSAPGVLMIVALIILGTVGIYFLYLWAAVAYLVFAILFYFLAMPFTMCRYCYFRVKETATDEKGKTIEELLPKDEWVESHLHKHVGQKHWATFMFIIWMLPIVLIVISFFLDFSLFALASLIGFISVLALFLLYLIRKKCPNCAIQEECYSSF